MNGHYILIFNDELNELVIKTNESVIICVFIIFFGCAKPYPVLQHHLACWLQFIHIFKSLSVFNFFLFLNFCCLFRLCYVCPLHSCCLALFSPALGFVCCSPGTGRSLCVQPVASLTLSSRFSCCPLLVLLPWHCRDSCKWSNLNYEWDYFT